MEVHADKIRITISSPGAVGSELKESTFDEAFSKIVNELYMVLAIPSEPIARAIAYAIEQPADVDIIEIVIRPTAQDFWSHPSSSRERRQVFAGLTALLNPA